MRMSVGKTRAANGVVSRPQDRGMGLDRRLERVY